MTGVQREDVLTVVVGLLRSVAVSPENADYVKRFWPTLILAVNAVVSRFLTPAVGIALPRRIWPFRFLYSVGANLEV